MFDPRRVRRQIEEARRAASGRRWPATFADRLTAPLPLLAPVIRAREAWEEAGRAREDLWDLAIGETRILP